MSDNIKVIFDFEPQFVRFRVGPEDREDSRAFMKLAIENIARELIANGCVQFRKHYDLAKLGEWEAWLVTAGRPERQPLP